MQKIFLHADDFGNSLHISEIIYKCFEKGSLNSTSIIVNSDDLDDSIKLIEDKNIRKVLHLNIAEGKSVTNKKFQYLSDEKGHFFRTWQGLVFEYYCLSSKKSEA